MDKKNIVKPIPLIMEDIKSAIADIINSSGLSPSLLEPIIRGFYHEISILKKNEIEECRREYEMQINENNKVE